MLSNQYRFHGHGSLRFVYQKGKKVRNEYIALAYTKNLRRSHPRFSVVVSKKVSKSAVKRNRIRRRIYEIIREEIPNIHGVHDVVVTVFTIDVLSLPHTELKKLLRNLLVKANLIS